jgi:hypothetical protein
MYGPLDHSVCSYRCEKITLSILQLVEPLLGNDSEIRKYTRAVTGQRAFQTKHVTTEAV